MAYWIRVWSGPAIESSSIVQQESAAGEIEARLRKAPCKQWAMNCEDE